MSNLVACLIYMTHNEQGFAMLGDLKNVKPGTAADWKTKVQDYNKKLNRIPSTGTAAGSELQPIVEGS